MPRSALNPGLGPSFVAPMDDNVEPAPAPQGPWPQRRSRTLSLL